MAQSALFTDLFSIAHPELWMKGQRDSVSNMLA
jgi:hypothetical protein